MSKRPSFQFYPADWRNDPALQLCGMAAHGLWMQMLCIMHDAEPYGTLRLPDGRNIDAKMLARLVRESVEDVSAWMAELEENGVYSREGETIFSRRMMRDEEIRAARAAGGHAGAEHGVKGAEHGKKGGRPRKEKTPLTDNERGDIKPPPSSSSSTASSYKNDVDTRARTRGENDDENSSSHGEPIDADGTPTIAREAAATAGIALSSPRSIATAIDITRAWVGIGATHQEIRTVIAERLASAQEPIHSLRYFDNAIRQAVARRQNGITPQQTRRATGKPSAWTNR